MEQPQPNEAQQELIFKLQMYEQHINQIQQQLQAVEQGNLDLNNLMQGVEELKGNKDKEVLAQIGKGIYVKTKLDSEDLIVDIGNKNLVTKSIDQTKELIKEQLEKIGEAKEELNGNLEKVNEEMKGLVEEFQKSQEHVHGPDCNHDH